MRRDSDDDLMTALRGKLIECKECQPVLNSRKACISLIYVIATVTIHHAAPLDGTRLKFPQLSTSHGPIKSGGTIKEEIEDNLDMLLTDMPMTDAEMQLVYDARGEHLLHVATAVTAVVPCYSVSGLVEPLNFSAATLAAILLGKITRWNDPAIAALNRSARLPSSGIIVIGHAIEDGSTYALTDFLSKSNAEWRQSIGRVRSLAKQPARLRGQAPEDLAVLVKQTPNSIALTELWAAKGQNLQIGRVRNRSGHYIDPSPASMTSAALSAAAEIHDDFRVSITDSKGATDYPISSFTWVVIPARFPDSEKRSVVTSFLKWVITDGQSSLESTQLGRLPSAIADREIRLIDSLR